MENLENLKVLFEEKELQERIGELAKQIDKDYEGTNEVVVICVLKGAVFFTVDLVRKMKTPVIPPLIEELKEYIPTLYVFNAYIDFVK